MFARFKKWWRKNQEINRRKDLILKELFKEVDACTDPLSHQWTVRNRWSIIVWEALGSYRYRSEVCVIRFEPSDSGDILVFGYGGWETGKTEYKLTQREELLEKVRTACKN